MGTAAKKLGERKHERSRAPKGNAPAPRLAIGKWDQMGQNPTRSGYNFLKNSSPLSTGYGVQWRNA